MKPDGPYVKYIYWLTSEEESKLRAELKVRDIKMRSARGIVCSPMNIKNRISSVAPEVWDDTCARQGSWYRESDRNGLYLVISSFDLAGYEEKKAAIITLSEFNPPRLASEEEKIEMVNDPEFREIIPSRWQSAGDTEKKIFLMWARRLGSDVDDFDSLYLTHTANHANFIKPRLFTKQGPETIPYSIDRSALLCSSCLELFQVLGREHPKKLVAPCPGACMFARLKPDQYLLVVTPQQQEA